jgi:hypothetical protein
MKPLKVVQDQELDISQVNMLVTTYRFNDFRRYRSVSTTACKKYLKGIVQEALENKAAHSWAAYRGSELVGLSIMVPLHWESTHFGKRMASLITVIDDSGYHQTFDSADRLIDKALRYASVEKVHHLNIRVDVEEIAVIHVLEKHGFRMMDTLLTYAYDKNKTKLPDLQPKYEICPFSPEDRNSIVNIAKSSFKNYPNRFNLDVNIPHEKAHSFYTEWAKNCCNGAMAEEILVAKRKGKIVAFLAYRRNPALLRHTGIPIMGSGLAGFSPLRVNAYYDLMLEGLRSYPGLSADFETHLWNTTFINIFRHLDFHHVRAKHSFHRWLMD